jgi:spermidine/putrescine transport system ATP-binding protein
MIDVAVTQPAGPNEALVRLRNVSKAFGRIVAVEPLDLDIRRGEFLAILGPSGCGKTTLLRMIGGFLTPDTGRIEIDGQDVTTLGPERRPTNMVFQGYGLFPHMNVEQNIAYGLRMAKVPRAESEKRVQRVIDLVRLGELARRAPDALSGGQQQRVALARALVMEPKVLLLDEPLAALDLQLRKVMQEELRRIHASIGGTFVIVTHDQGEALGLANRIAVMNMGRVVQEGSPEDIYARPATRFVANFIGDANVFTGQRRNGNIALEGGARFADAGRDGAVFVIVRPEALKPSTQPDEFPISLPATVVDMVYLGSHLKLKVALPGGQEVTVHDTDLSLRDRIRPSGPVYLGWSAAQHRVIDEP